MALSAAGVKNIFSSYETVQSKPCSEVSINEASKLSSFISCCTSELVKPLGKFWMLKCTVS